MSDEMNSLQETKKVKRTKGNFFGLHASANDMSYWVYKRHYHNG